MWFRNLQFYRFSSPSKLTATKLEEKLAQRAFMHCGKMDPMSRGWYSPLGEPEGSLVRAVKGCFMFALRTEEKLLPASVIRQIAGDRIAEVEEQQGHRLGSKRRREIREQVTDELLPRAFSKLRSTYAYIDTNQGWLIVDAGTPKKGEEVTELLLKCLDDIQLGLPRVQASPSVLMTEWVQSGEAPGGFTIDTECELVEPTDAGATVRCTRQNLETDEVRSHLKAGKRVTKLGMTWNDRISFQLTEQLQIKRLGFLDMLQEEAANAGADSGEEQFDADFAIMSAELARFVPAVLEALGGEAGE
jgi:recombination associated protein RdgC